MTKPAPMRLAMVAAVPLIASGCDRPVSTPLPPAADVEAATEPKPLPPVSIVTDEAAALQYDLAVEAWGERVRSAGVRVCEWLNAAVKSADYKCGDAQ